MLSRATHVQARLEAQLSSSLRQSHRVWWRRVAAQFPSSRCCNRIVGHGRLQAEVVRCCISHRCDRQVLVGRHGQVVAGDPAVPTWSAGSTVVVAGLPFSSTFAQPSSGARRFRWSVVLLIGCRCERECPGGKQAAVCQWPEMRQRCPGSLRRGASERSMSFAV
jgi:hypothetical protein